MISRWYALLAATGGGLCMTLAFPRFNLWPMAIVGVALMSLATQGQRPRFSGLIGFVFGLGFFVPTLRWTGIYVGAFPWLLLAFVEACYFAAMATMLPRLHRTRGATLWIAGMWVLQEAIRGRWPFGGFGWGRLAFSQADSPLRWLATLGGTPLVSFAVALLGAALAEVVVSVGLRHTAAVRLPSIALAAAGLLIASTPLLARQWAPSGDSTTVVAVIQGSTPDRGLEFAARRRQVLDNHVAQTEKLANDIRLGQVAQPQLVIWPENSSDIDPFHNADAASEIQAAADAARAPILVGAILDGPGETHIRNAGLMWFPHSESGKSGPGQLYIKRHPVPFAEYIPLRSIARVVSSKVDLVGSDMVAGGGDGLIHDGPFPFGDIICFEVTYDSLVQSSVAAGAQMLVAQTNNATFGHTAETYQQLAMSRLRAVETQRVVVESSTTGVSAIIDAGGQVIDQSAELFTPARIVARVQLSTRLTPAVRLGPFPEYALAAMAAVAFAVAKLRSSRRVSKQERAGLAVDAAPPPIGDTFRTEGETVISMSLANSAQTPGRVLVIIPTYNERDNVEQIVQRVRKATPQTHILVVDDGSPDGTGALADELAAHDSAVQVLHRTEKAGLGSAYIAGFEFGLREGYDVLVEMDADGSHAPEQLQSLLDALVTADLVLGSRWVNGGTVVNWPKRREVLSRGGNLYTRLALGLSLRDATGGYRAYRRQVLEKIDYAAVASQGYCFQVDLVWRSVLAGFKVVEVPITFTERERGESKMSGSIVTEALWRVTQWGFSHRVRRAQNVTAAKEVPNPTSGEKPRTP